jgi:S1-C subfamily serine protease
LEGAFLQNDRVNALAFFLGVTAAISPAHADSLSKQIFDGVSPYVFQLKTAVGPNSPKASYGSAFVVRADGLLVTNYHVISQAVREHRKYKMYLMVADHPLEARILALDVVHDLAVVRAPTRFAGALALRDVPPPQGSRLFSIGMPADLNMSIIEGIHNDVIRRGRYETIHMSSPLNAGMSGGPTVDERGVVVGVNVATLWQAHNISFAVPARFIRALLAQAAHPPDKVEGFQPLLEAQLMGLQKDLVKDMEVAAKERLSLGNWKVAMPPEMLKCWGENQDDSEKSFLSYRQICNLDQAAFLSEDVLVGTYEVNFQTLTNARLNRWQFFSLVEDRYNSIDQVYFNLFLKLLASENQVLTAPRCDEGTIVNRHGVPLRVNYCLQGYIPFPKLYNLDMKLSTLLREGPALLVRSGLRAFSEAGIKRVMEMLFDGIERN